jgi:hypothetical protein
MTTGESTPSSIARDQLAVDIRCVPARRGRRRRDTAPPLLVADLRREKMQPTFGLGAARLDHPSGDGGGGFVEIETPIMADAGRQ